MLRLRPEVAYYRTFGAKVQEQRNIATAALSLAPDEIQYLQKRQQETAFSSYWDVAAQYSNIHLDVFGQNAESDAAKNACAGVGRFFQWLKIADELIEKAGTDSLINLLSIRKMLSQKGQKPKTMEERILVSEFNTLGLDNYPELNKVYEIEKELVSPCLSDSTRYSLRGEQGFYLGEIQYEILKKHFPSLPDYAKDFFAYAGSAGNYFDDFKDWEIDRKRGHGYEQTLTRYQLLRGFVENIKKARKNLTSEERRKNTSFYLLAGLFQMREIIGIKDRT